MSDARLVFQLRRELAAARAANDELLRQALDACERLISEACAFAFDLGMLGQEIDHGTNPRVNDLLERLCSMEQACRSGVDTRAPVVEQPRSTLRDNDHLALEK